MSKKIFRLSFLCFVLVTIALGLPGQAQTACPGISCVYILSACSALGCGPGGGQIGQCVDSSGATRNLYAFGCPQCFSFQPCTFY